MLDLAAARGKLNFVRGLTQIPNRGVVPALPARDVQFVKPDQMPERPGFASAVGQRRLLHDLGNIELQAMELCYRTLIEYPEAPEAFREELMKLLNEEAGHFALCLDGLADLKGHWGEFPVNLGLWSAVRPEDSLLDRILIVHRYLEGNGLDAGDVLLRRLAGVEKSPVHAIVGTIAREELDHVAFGSRWFQQLCREQKLDPSDDFKIRFDRLLPQMPRRIEYVSRELRTKAGFTDSELDFLEAKRESWSRFKKVPPNQALHK